MSGEFDGVRIVAMPAEIDLDNAAQVRAALTQALADGIKVLVADMTATIHCTLEGLHALFQARAAAAAAGAQLRLAALSPARAAQLGTHGSRSGTPAVPEPGRGHRATRSCRGPSAIVIT